MFDVNVSFAASDLAIFSLGNTKSHILILETSPFANFYAKSHKLLTHTHIHIHSFIHT